MWFPEAGIEPARLAVGDFESDHLPIGGRSFCHVLDATVATRHTLADPVCANEIACCNGVDD